MKRFEITHQDFRVVDFKIGNGDVKLNDQTSFDSKDQALAFLKNVQYIMPVFAGNSDPYLSEWIDVWKDRKERRKLLIVEL